jgi:hypothetical protein
MNPFSFGTLFPDLLGAVKNSYLRKFGWRSGPFAAAFALEDAAFTFGCGVIYNRPADWPYYAFS